ncbi:MAG: L-histidine N(alpha)-methyltransferase [Bacteroidales bacterium]|nr:L-histidine N(alpha)-methyltransferase [Bacteroidales bacterium]
MNYNRTVLLESDKVKIENYLEDLSIDFIRKEIITGLTLTDKYISSKFFYNETGSKLFETITHLTEYYPTRIERGILRKISPDFMSKFKNIDIIELGSGDCSKIKILLNSILPQNISSIRYIPIDISWSTLKKSAKELTILFPDLNIKGLVADFFSQLNIIPSENKRLFLFLGSTLGNFTENNIINFLSQLSSIMHTNDLFLLGIDLAKETSVLNQAYNDEKGITAQFNKNILNAINSIIGSDFNINNYKHQAFFNKKKSQIEMYLISTKDQIIRTPFHSKPIQIKKDESIHTENSYKFSINKIKQISAQTKLKINEIFFDKKKWFALILFSKKINSS